jgi:hypothetical protein
MRVMATTLTDRATAPRRRAFGCHPHRAHRPSEAATIVGRKEPT